MNTVVIIVTVAVVTIVRAEESSLLTAEIIPSRNLVSKYKTDVVEVGDLVDKAISDGNRISCIVRVVIVEVNEALSKVSGLDFNVGVAIFEVDEANSDVNGIDVVIVEEGESEAAAVAIIVE